MSAPRVLITRDPAAARALAALLRERGCEPCAARLLEARLPQDTGPLRALLRDALRPTVPTWLCVTSATTVAALAAVAEEPEWGPALDAARTGSGTRPSDAAPAGSAAEAPVPEADSGDPAAVSAGLRIAAVGSATARALAEYGVGVDFVPARTASAAGMLEEWPEEPFHGQGSAPRALLPASARAATTLGDGLRARGYDVRDVTAYDMVPAPTDRPLLTVVPERDDPEELDSASARAACARGELAAVVATAPSRVAALLDGSTPGAATSWIAIGEPTARALWERGIQPVVAARPTPEALAAAVVHALGPRG
ncbi:uroporphyrinogen-III synthase [Kocuria tytonis]|uniref:Uroporphyrinogen-III synthase n=1 Tax=Kocuria tytonis TaxID=2054280 RepID=A0A495A9L9_9MICC|nr:uroporphyrinogen-III synthase [Kocuria tytonis]RKQ36746.1 uroporphyrinogen-III synthase [Kocuria tytonis]